MVSAGAFEVAVRQTSIFCWPTTRLPWVSCFFEQVLCLTEVDFVSDGGDRAGAQGAVFARSPVREDFSKSAIRFH